MSKENLAIWNSLSKSDPKYLKKVSFGSRSFTAIDPQYQVRMMTEQFGPIGLGWGWDSRIETVTTANGDMAVFAHVAVWHTDNHHRFGPFTGCRKFYDMAKNRMNEDAPKMAVTDGLTKALSHIGCNADVFLGEMDGNKYAADSGQSKGGW